MVKVTTIFYGKNGIQHTGMVSQPVMAENLRYMAKNLDAVDLANVNHIIINTDEKKVIQASGYSRDRGSFCDTY